MGCGIFYEAREYASFETRVVMLSHWTYRTPISTVLLMKQTETDGISSGPYICVPSIFGWTLVA